MKTRGKILLTLGWIAAAATAVAQGSFRQSAEQIHARYVDNLSDHVGLKLQLYNYSDGFNVTSGESSIYKIRPNTLLVSKYNLHYRFISLSFSYAPRFLPINNDDDLRGETTHFGISSRTYIKQFSQEFYYERTRGYYLSNTHEFNPDWKKGDPLVQFPKLVYSRLGGRTVYQLNPNFSIKAMYDQTERQTRNAGTPVFALAYNYHSTKNPDPTTTSHQSSSNLELFAQAGYLHTWVMPHNFYFSGGLGVGMGGIRTRLTTETNGVSNIDRRYAVLYHGAVNLVLGYNSRRFFSGVSMISSGETYNQGDAGVVALKKSTFSVHLGYRFKAPRAMKMAFDSLNTKFHAE